MSGSWRTLLVLAWLSLASSVFAQTASLGGSVRDETGGALPGVTVEVRDGSDVSSRSVTDARGIYRLDGVVSGRHRVVFTLINFAPIARDVEVRPAAASNLDVVLHVALDADVTVTGRRTFGNLADAEHPEENLLGIAQSASQGAITAAQIEERPLMRDGEVLESVPGVMVTQHSGEGKANQYFLRGFNLDHGTDFSTTVAGVPVNLPTHAHGQGYTDLNFLIPELVSGVQYSKGPYFADQGDFATAGAATINYTNSLDGPLASVDVGGGRYARGLLAASPRVGRGHLLAALEASRNDGPWTRPDDYRKVNGVLRYSRGDTVSGLSLTVMGYHGRWNATDQVPRRAVDAGLVGRYGTIDATDGGHSYRYSVAGD